ncbi:MAG: peptidoglycan editing factor PgeF [Bacteroides sp.]|nr:peptidoglycan editing factor PgeF [Bacteroides sp.]
MIPLAPDKSMLGYEVMASCPDIFCFVTTRHGGYSKGNYASFNCTPYVGDDDECVRRNQEKLLSLLPQQPHTLVIPYQTHGTESLVIDSTYLNADDNERHARLQGIDSLITSEPGCCLCISTADCIPILLHDSKNGVVAAVHAGWRGTVNRILARTLQRMNLLYGTTGKDVKACIGPGISLPAFEVGEEVYEAFRENGFPTDYIAEWKPDTHKHHIDLWAANRMQLTDFGIPDEQIESAGICTYTRYEEFFSARRLGIRSGRILSGIMKLSTP